MFETFQRRVLLSGRYRLLTAHHVGSGGAQHPNTLVDDAIIRDSQGLPFVPGSSVKGVLRSAAEQIVAAAGPPYSTCLSGCGVTSCPTKTDDLADALAAGTSVYDAVNASLCTTCLLFGNQLQASRVAVADLRTMQGLGTRVGVRTGVAIERESETAKAGILYSFETLDPSVSLDFEARIDNATDAQVGLLLLALDFVSEGLANVGGRSSRGLGRGRFDLEEVFDLSSPKDLLGHLAGRLTPITHQVPAPSAADAAEAKERIVLSAVATLARLNDEGTKPRNDDWQHEAGIAVDDMKPFFPDFPSLAGEVVQRGWADKHPKKNWYTCTGEGRDASLAARPVAAAQGSPLEAWATGMKQAFLDRAGVPDA